MSICIISKCPFPSEHKSIPMPQPGAAGGRRATQLSPAQMPVPQYSETSVPCDTAESRNVCSPPFIGFPSPDCKLRR